MILLSHTLNIIIRSKRGKGYIVAWCHTCSQKKFAKEMKPLKNGLEILNQGPIIIVGLYLLGLKINTAHKTSGLCSHFFLISFHWGSHRLCDFCIFPFLSFYFHEPNKFPNFIPCLYKSSSFYQLLWLQAWYKPSSMLSSLQSDSNRRSPQRGFCLNPQGGILHFRFKKQWKTFSLFA